MLKFQALRPGAFNTDFKLRCPTWYTVGITMPISLQRPWIYATSHAGKLERPRRENFPSLCSSASSRSVSSMQGLKFVHFSAQRKHI
jgi:hypothetical protein